MKVNLARRAGRKAPPCLARIDRRRHAGAAMLMRLRWRLRAVLLANTLHLERRMPTMSTRVREE